MPRPKTKVATSRLNLALSQTAMERLDRLHTTTDSRSPTETISRALAVYEMLVTEHAQGTKIVLRRKDDKESELLMASV